VNPQDKRFTVSPGPTVLGLVSAPQEVARRLPIIRFAVSPAVRCRRSMGQWQVPLRREVSRFNAVRSRTSSRSYSANDPKTPIIMRPAAVEESIPSVLEINVTPRSVRALTVSKMCNVLRPNRPVSTPPRCRPHGRTPSRLPSLVGRLVRRTLCPRTSSRRQLSPAPPAVDPKSGTTVLTRTYPIRVPVLGRVPFSSVRLTIGTTPFSRH
jgi:hypothetical protein